MYLTKEQVESLNDVHGYFEYGDSQGDVSHSFANDAVALWLKSVNACFYAANGTYEYGDYCWEQHSIELGSIEKCENFIKNDILNRNLTIIIDINPTK